MRIRHTVRLPAAGFTALLIIVTACGSAAYSAVSPSHAAARAINTPAQSSGSLVVGFEAEPTSLDAAQPTDINTMHVLTQVYDTLVQWEPSGKLGADLATSWRTLNGGRSFIFTLRPHVRFSNGDPLTAAAVVFTFERMLDPHNPGYKYGPFPFGKFFFGDIVTVKALSPMRVQFDLNAPNAGFLNGLTVITAGIVDPKAALRQGKSFALHGAGTGPFMLSTWKRGVELILKDNPYYWGTRPGLRQITFVPIVQAEQRSTELRTGAVNLVVNPAPVTLSSLRSNGDRIAETAGPHIWWIGMNLTEKPFNNRLVRQALNYAIDREAIIKGILYGTGIPADQPLSPGQLGYNSHVDPYNYNPKKAKALLAQAGYPHGFSTTMVVPTSGSGMQDPTAMGTAIQGYLAAVGVKVNIIEMEWGSFLSKVNLGARKAHMDMWELSWMDSAVDPWLVLDPLLARSSWPPGFNSGYYNDPQVNSLLSEGLAEQNPNRRAKLYQHAEALINRDAPWIFVDHAKEVVAYGSSVHNFQLSRVFPFLIHLAQVRSS